MPTLLRDARTGRLVKPPSGRLRAAFGADWRARTLSGPFLSACAWLGLDLSAGPAGKADVFLGAEPPPGPPAIWLKVAAGRAPEGDSAAAQWLCLTTRYGEPLDFGAGLSRAAAQLDWVRRRGEELSAAPAPNRAALAAYLQRLRQGLSRDFDLAEASACLDAALRPGALSTGTQRAFLERFLAIFPLPA